MVGFLVLISSPALSTARLQSQTIHLCVGLRPKNHRLFMPICLPVVWYLRRVSLTSHCLSQVLPQYGPLPSSNCSYLPNKKCHSIAYSLTNNQESVLKVLDFVGVLLNYIAGHRNIEITYVLMGWINNTIALYAHHVKPFVASCHRYSEREEIELECNHHRILQSCDMCCGHSYRTGNSILIFYFYRPSLYQPVPLSTSAVGTSQAYFF